MARAARAMAMATKRAMAMATTWAMATATRVYYASLLLTHCAVEATERHANPWNIDMIFIDKMCYDVGEWPEWTTRRHEPPCEPRGVT
jgi:hypothetical protein